MKSFILRNLLLSLITCGLFILTLVAALALDATARYLRGLELVDNSGFNFLPLIVPCVFAFVLSSKFTTANTADLETDIFAFLRPPYRWKLFAVAVLVAGFASGLSTKHFDRQDSTTDFTAVMLIVACVYMIGDTILFVRLFPSPQRLRATFHHLSTFFLRFLLLPPVFIFVWFVLTRITLAPFA